MTLKGDSILPENTNTFSMHATDYLLKHTIGKSGNSTVVRALCKTNQMHCAIKIFDLDSSSPDEIEKVRCEIQMMADCDHKNIVKYYTSFLHEDELWMVMPLLEGGSCFDIMRFSFHEGFPENICATILREVLCGLNYLHTHGRIHRDVKAANILIDDQGHVKLSDFGVTGVLLDYGQKNNLRQTFVGTPCWMAPEVMEQKRGYNSSADIWSFGITALELANGKAPYFDFSPMKVLFLTLKNPPPTLKDTDQHKFSPAFHEIVRLSLQKDPLKRVTAAKLLEHSFFKTHAKTHEFLKSQIMEKLPPLSIRYSLLDSKKKEETLLQLRKESCSSSSSNIVNNNTNTSENSTRNDTNPREETKMQIPDHPVENPSLNDSQEWIFPDVEETPEAPEAPLKQKSRFFVTSDTSNIKTKTETKGRFTVQTSEKQVNGANQMNGEKQVNGANQMNGANQVNGANQMNGANQVNGNAYNNSSNLLEALNQNITILNNQIKNQNQLLQNLQTTTATNAKHIALNYKMIVETNSLLEKLVSKKV